MHFRQAETADLNALVELQNKNSIVLDATIDRSDGFLSSAFTAEDFAAINKDGAIIVATGDKLSGFLCASSAAFNKRAGLPAAMLARFNHIECGGKKLSEWPCIITGPVCVDKESRGSGVFAGLYEALWPRLSSLYPGQYEMAVALVSTANPRSLAAHQKIGMVVVDRFEYADKTYDTIARQIS